MKTTMSDIYRIMGKINSEGGKVRVEQAGSGGLNLYVDRISPYDGKTIDKGHEYFLRGTKKDIYEALIKIRFIPQYRPYSVRANRRKKTRCWKGYKPVKGKRPYSKGSCRRIKRNSSKMNFPMDSSGDSAIGELEIQRKDGEYDIWTIIKRGRLFVIGTPTNTGLLSEYYYKMEPGETVQNALQEVNADLEVLATDGESYMSRVKKVPKNKKIPANALRGLRRNPKSPRRQGHLGFAFNARDEEAHKTKARPIPGMFYRVYFSHPERGETTALIFKGEQLRKLSISDLSRYWPLKEGLKMAKVHFSGPFESWDMAFMNR